MKKVLKRIALGIAALVVLLVGGVLTRFYVLAPKSRAATDVKAPATPEAIARGAYLANSVAACMGCHSKSDATKPGDPIEDGMLGSGRDFGGSSNMVHSRSPNLTPDKEHGIGNFTDGELLRALREGISHDGRPLFPMMPYSVYRDSLSDADALSIIAYLRTLKPIASDQGKAEIKFPVSMFIRLEPRPVETPAAAPPADPLGHGEWLLKVAACGECHDSFDDSHQKIPGRHFAGGGSFDLPNGGGKVNIPNITSSKTTGIGTYSDEALMHVFNEGKNQTGRSLYMMPWQSYKTMTDADKKDLLLALRAVPAVENAVPASNVK